MPRTGLIALAMMLLLSSCAPNLPANDFCQLAHAIYINKDDKISPDTARQILMHDVNGEYLCGWSYVK